MKLHQKGIKHLLKSKNVTVTDVMIALEFSDSKREIAETLEDIFKECSKYQKMIVIADCGEDDGMVCYRCNYTDAEIVYELECLKMRTLGMVGQDNDCEECSE